MRLLVVGLAVLIAGCSSGLKEVAFMDQGRYVVSRSLVNDRWTAGQPHAQGVFVCRQKISSEDLSELRKDGAEHSQYMDCTPATEYAQASDQPVATLYKGPIEAAILGGSIGAGLAMSGDTVTQNGSRTSSSTSVSVTQKSVTKGGKRR